MEKFKVNIELLNEVVDGKYQILADGRVDVEGNLDIYQMPGVEKVSDIATFRKVSGVCKIQDVDLEGCPEEIEDLFDYTGTSLVGGPKTAKKVWVHSPNSLEGSPEDVDVFVVTDYNGSFRGGPKTARIVALENSNLQFKEIMDNCQAGDLVVPKTARKIALENSNRQLKEITDHCQAENIINVGLFSNYDDFLDFMGLY